MSRSQTRDMLFRLVFSYFFNKDGANMSSLQDMIEEAPLPTEEEEYLQTCFESIQNNIDEIECLLEKNLKKGISVKDIYPVDRAILLCAISQINYFSEDKPLVINESVRLAKKYSTENSPKFINGVLSSIYDLKGCN